MNKRILLVSIVCFIISFRLLSQNDTITKEKYIHLGASNFKVSKYIPKSGTQIGKGAANQALGYLTFKNITGYIWINYGFPDNQITEADLAIFYDFKISDNFLKGKLSGNIGFVEWIFPVWELQNKIIESNIKYKGWINSSLLITQMLADSNVDFGTRLHIQFSKTFIIIIYNTKTTLTPSITSAYHLNFYEMKGLAFVTPGIEYSFELKNIELSAFINNQFSIKFIEVEKETFFYTDLGLKYDF